VGRGPSTGHLGGQAGVPEEERAVVGGAVKEAGWYRDKVGNPKNFCCLISSHFFLSCHVVCSG